MIHLDYRDARPIYAQIIDGFRSQIGAGILQPGEKLPSVRELAAMLAINPNTIQRAYRQLEMEGWIVSMQGKGCFVSGAPSVQTRETERLLGVFDDTVKALSQLGITREALIRRLTEGGTCDD